MAEAEAELQTFTSIMDALVRISVSMTLILLRYLFKPRVPIFNDTSLLFFVPPYSHLTVQFCVISSRPG